MVSTFICCPKTLPILAQQLTHAIKSVFILIIHPTLLKKPRCLSGEMTMVLAKCVSTLQLLGVVHTASLLRGAYYNSNTFISKYEASRDCTGQFHIGGTNLLSQRSLRPPPANLSPVRNTQFSKYASESVRACNKFVTLRQASQHNLKVRSRLYSYGEDIWYASFPLTIPHNQFFVFTSRTA